MAFQVPTYRITNGRDLEGNGCNYSQKEIKHKKCKLRILPNHNLDCALYSNLYLPFYFDIQRSKGL